MFHFVGRPSDDDGAICAAKHLELVRVYHLANPYTDLTNSLRGTKYFLRETNTAFRDSQFFTSNKLVLYNQKTGVH